MTRERVRLVSPTALGEALASRAASYRTLGRWAGCSHAMIGYLVHGDIATCTKSLADRIERALSQESGSLFLPISSNVKIDNLSLDGEENP